VRLPVRWKIASARSRSFSTRLSKTGFLGIPKA
jgi:hypothetical protein